MLLEREDIPDSLKRQINIHRKALAELYLCLREFKRDILTLGAKVHPKEIELLTSIKGISVIIAIALMSDIGDIKRFKNGKKLCSYLRSAPGVDSSNMSTKNLRTNKFCRKVSITMISQALNHIILANTKLNK